MVATVATVNTVVAKAVTKAVTTVATNRPTNYGQGCNYTDV